MRKKKNIYKKLVEKIPSRRKKRGVKVMYKFITRGLGKQREKKEDIKGTLIKI